MNTERKPELMSPTPRNILFALGGRLRVEPKNIHVDEIVDELGPCTGAQREYVRQRIVQVLRKANVPYKVRNGAVTFFPEAI